MDTELYARIRRLFFAEHWKVGTISAELGIHHDTVRGAIEADRFGRQTKLIQVSQLDPYKLFIQETLEKHPRLRSTRLFYMIGDRGYPGSIRQLRRYVSEVRPVNQKEAFFRLRTMPGEQGQVDWGQFGKILIGKAKRILSCFVMVLSYSRGIFARFTLDQKMESFLYCHSLAFQELRGVPRELLYDNLKSVVLERQGEHIRFHPQILEMAGHYHFAPKPCAPYRGNEKGKVERTIQYLRHSFFAARHFSSVADLNEQLRTWIDRIAHQRVVPGDPDSTLVVEALRRESDLLIPLPANSFPCDHVTGVVSGKTPYIRFDANDYSIPPEWVRKPLTLAASESEIRFLDATGNIIAQHVRSYDRLQQIEDPSHLTSLAEKKKEARELRGRDELRSQCSHAASFLEALCLRGESLRAHTSRLNQLLKLYGATELDKALEEAMKRGAISSDSVTHLLEQKRRAKRQKAPLPIILPDDPRIRNLQVTPHELGPYDALSNSEPQLNQNEQKDK